MIQIFRNLNKPIIYFSNGYVEKKCNIFTYKPSYKVSGYIAIHNILEYTNNIIFFSFVTYYLTKNTLSLRIVDLQSELINVMPLEFILKTDSDFINLFSTIENFYESLIFI
jgi:hypothetical protein